MVNTNGTTYCYSDFEMSPIFWRRKKISNSHSLVKRDNTAVTSSGPRTAIMSKWWTFAHLVQPEERRRRIVRAVLRRHESLKRLHRNRGTPTCVPSLRIRPPIT